MSNTHSDDCYVWGQAIQETMAARGCEMTLDESRQFVRALLRLVELGALVAVAPDDRDEPGSQVAAT